jgi:hypothetical protein
VTDLIEHLGLLNRSYRAQGVREDSDSFKEWYHVNILDDVLGIDTLVNFSLTGNPFAPDQGEAATIVLVHERGKGWSGNLDQYDGLAATFSELSTNVAMGSSRLHWRDGSFFLDAALRDGSIVLSCELIPKTEPMMIWKNTPVGSGHINWLIVPWLEAKGFLSVGERHFKFEDARAYHDHNWGHWRWGENFAWDWGFSSRLGHAADGEAISFVYDRTTNLQRSDKREHTLAVWKGKRLLKLFTRRNIEYIRSRQFDPRKIGRVPGVMNLANQGQVLSVPAKVEIRAKENRDWLNISFCVEAARQIAVPAEIGVRTVELNESYGHVMLIGQIGKMPLELEGSACFEFVG